MRKILTLFTALLLLGSWTNVKAETTTVYCQMTYDWWCAGNATISLFAYGSGDPNADWPGQLMTEIDAVNHVWSINIDLTSYTHIIFARSNPGGGSGWGAQTEDLSISDKGDNNLYTITSSTAQWSGEGNKVTGTWSTYVPVTHTYTVAGEPASLFGETWKPALEANNMVDQNDGTYQLVKTGVELSACTAAFKVCMDHTWTSWPSSNYTLSIPGDGIYTVTITFNESSKAITANATKTGEAVVIPTIKLHGNFSGDWADTEAFTLAGNKETASRTIHLAASYTAYQFGVKIDGTWTANGAAFTRSSTSHEVVSGSGDLTLNADATGDYTFTWTYATNTLSVTYPAETGELDGPPTVEMKGTWDDWADAVSFTIAANEETATATKHFTPGEYGFKIILNGDEWRSNEYGYHREFTGATGITTNKSGNMTLTVDIEGDYTFTWTYATDGLSIGFPAATTTTYHLYVRNLTGWDTFDVFGYGDNKDYLGGWPGKTAADNTTTIDDASYNVYDFDVIDGASITMNLIFHNNVGEYEPGDLRQYFTVSEARDYYLTVKTDNTWEGKTGVKRFRACIPLEHVYGYQFDEFGDVDAEWPGAELTADAEGWYEFLVVKGRTVIFNTGNGAGAMQTGDLAYTEADPVADECAVWQGQTNVSGEPAKTYMFTIADCDAACTSPYERNVTNGNYGTIILPFEAAAVKGATLFSIAGKTGDEIGNEGGLFIDEADKLLKGVPYIFLATDNKLKVYYWPNQEFTPSADNLYTTNGLVGFIGANEDAEYTVEADAHNFILYNNDLWFVDSEAKIKSYRAFVDWSNVGTPSANPAPGRTRHLIGVHNIPTAIDAVQGDKVQGVKFIENGQLFIIKNGVKYNAQGIIVK